MEGDGDVNRVLGPIQSVSELGMGIGVMSECTALLGGRLGFGGVSDSGFSLCAVPTY